MSDPFYQTPFWKALRRRCLERDYHRCVSCGDRAFIADHIIGRRRWLAEQRSGSPDTLENLRSLCGVCDQRVKEKAGGKRANGGIVGVIGPDGWPVA